MSAESEYYRQQHLNRMFFVAVMDGDVEKAEAYRKEGADIDAIDKSTRLTPLHVTVALKDLEMMKYMVEVCGAAFKADGNGRWPTVLAAEARANGKICDYIVEQEAKYISLKP